MRRSLSRVLFLLGACLVLFGIALLHGAPLPPLPIVRGPLETLTATATDDLERVGYTLTESPADLGKTGKRERTYAFQGSSGFSATLRDEEYPPQVSISRQLAFDIRFSMHEGTSPSDMPGLTPKLIAEAQAALRSNAALVAGMGYLATAAGPGVTPEAMQAAVIDYLQRYRQPSSAVQEACAGCGSRDGFGDEYPGGRDMRRALDMGWPGWEIAAIRHYFDGDSTLTVRITARLPRRQP